MNDTADLILFNGRIATQDQQRTFVQAATISTLSFIL
jgi:predicted amidohydrolase YtcJ